MNTLFKKIIPILLAGFVFILFQGCASHMKHTVFNDEKTQAYQLEEISSWGFFAPTYQLQRAKICEVKNTLIKTNDFGTGYTKHEPVNCRLLTASDGYQKDLGTPIGPPLLQAAGSVGAGALIGDGIRDSEDQINNSNSQAQGQGQIQNQLQYQRQKSRGGGRY